MEAGDASPVFGVLELPSVKKGLGQLYVAQKVCAWYEREVEPFNIEDAAYEVPFAGIDTSVLAKQSELIGMLRMLFARAEIAPDGYTSNSWRKTLTGRGTAPKEIEGKDERRAWLKREAIKHCHLRGWNVTNDDEADACGILNKLMSTLPEHDSRNAANLPLFQENRSLAPKT